MVSALVFGRRLAWLRNAWASRLLVPVVPEQTTSELLRVLTYPKFRLNAADQTTLLEDYLPYAEIVSMLRKRRPYRSSAETSMISCSLPWQPSLKRRWSAEMPTCPS